MKTSLKVCSITTLLLSFSDYALAYQSNYITHRNASAKVIIDRHNGIVTKTITKKKYLSRGVFEREIKWLNTLEPFDRVPKLIRVFPQRKQIVMTYVGERLTKHNAPPDLLDQVDYIVQSLKKYHCCHNDIKPAEILVNNGKVHLVDFGWATEMGRPVPKSWSGRLGSDYKAPWGFDDAYSMNKAIKAIMSKQ